MILMRVGFWSRVYRGFLGFEIWFWSLGWRWLGMMLEGFSEIGWLFIVDRSLVRLGMILRGLFRRDEKWGSLG